jgi:hypothetical protein
MTIVEFIQSMLAPGIMISACGLLLLGMNNKYSLVVNRIRLLDEEKRKLKTDLDSNKISVQNEKRLNNIKLQVEKFRFRIKLVRNAVLFYSIAVAFFIISSLNIGLQTNLKDERVFITAVTFFLLGMISVLLGIITAAREVWKGFEIVEIELQDD